MALSYQSGLTTFDGIFGLSPLHNDTRPSLIYKLHEQGIIKEKTISLLLSARGNPSFATFGGYNEDYIKQDPLYDNNREHI